MAYRRKEFTYAFHVKYPVRKMATVWVKIFKDDVVTQDFSRGTKSTQKQNQIIVDTVCL